MTDEEKYVMTKKDLELYEECLKFIFSSGEYRGCNILALDECQYGIDEIKKHTLKDAIKKERSKLISKIKKEISTLDYQYGACDFWSRPTVEEIEKKINSIKGSGDKE